MIQGEQTTKINIGLMPHHVKELNAIERETDRPRTRIIKRAIEEYLLRYRAAHPEFAKRHPRVGVELVERDLKPGLQTDVVIMRGVRREVIMNPDGSWRLPTEDDYIPLDLGDAPGSTSIID